MIKKFLVLPTLGLLLSGCFIAPMALVVPAASGFSTASIAQSALTTGANFVVISTILEQNPNSGFISKLLG